MLLHLPHPTLATFSSWVPFHSFPTHNSKFFPQSSLILSLRDNFNHLQLSLSNYDPINLSISPTSPSRQSITFPPLPQDHIIISSQNTSLQISSSNIS